MQSIHQSDLKKGEFTILQADQINIRLSTSPERFYRHGWQSWSLAAWTAISQLPVQKPDIFHPLQIDANYAHEKKPHGSWIAAVEFPNGDVLLCGSLDTDAHVMLSGYQLTGTYETGTAGEWFIMLGSEQEVFRNYAAEIGKRFSAAKGNPAPRVWCSWYSLYTAIDEIILGEIIAHIADLPFDVLQIDDGWQNAIGDWTPNGKFPSGMAALAERIKSSGRRAGIWLAPLIATRSSRLFRDHKDWFLHDTRGRLVSAGFNWGERLFALDATHPAVVTWLTELMHQVRIWGFDYLKLDFLYAGALRGRRYENLPREKAYRKTLKLMRQGMGADAFFLACGTPILPALGLSDAIRIGPDVSHEWEKYRDSTLLCNFTTPGTRNALRTSLHRLWLDPLTHLDPDIVYFSGRENGLSVDQKNLLRDLAFICRFKATSDLPQWLDDLERSNIREFLTSDPSIEQLGRYTYRIQNRVVDFSPAIPLPQMPTGLMAVWGRFLGWLGSQPWVLRVIKRLDDRAIARRRNGL